MHYPISVPLFDLHIAILCSCGVCVFTRAGIQSTFRYLRRCVSVCLFILVRTSRVHTHVHVCVQAADQDLCSAYMHANMVSVARAQVTCKTQSLPFCIQMCHVVTRISVGPNINHVLCAISRNKTRSRCREKESK